MYRERVLQSLAHSSPPDKFCENDSSERKHMNGDVVLGASIEPQINNEICGAFFSFNPKIIYRFFLVCSLDITIAFEK